MVQLVMDLTQLEEEVVLVELVHLQVIILQEEQEEQVLLIQYQDHRCHMAEAVAAEDQALAEQVQRAVEQDTED